MVQTTDFGEGNHPAHLRKVDGTRISRILGPLSMPGNIPIGIFLPRRMWSGSIQIWSELVLGSARVVHPCREPACQAPKNQSRIAKSAKTVR